MDIAINCYCRLCADLKDRSELLNLQLNKEKREEIVEMLTRVNAVIDFRDELLPKTVCFDCLNCLNSAFDFVQSIENAQGILSHILFVDNVKEETLESNNTYNNFFDDENFVVYAPELDDHIYAKRECDEVADEAIEPQDNVKNENVEVNKEINKKDVETPKQVTLNREIKKRRNKSNVKNTAITTRVPTGVKLEDLPVSQQDKTWRDFNWTCAHCGTIFLTVDELISHSIQFHNRCNDFRCIDCNWKKLRLNQFLAHVKRHRKYLRLSCYKCLKKFSTEFEARKHAKEHKTKYTCEGCNTNFVNAQELKDHTKFSQPRPLKAPLAYKPKKDDLACKICDKVFEHHINLTKHLHIHTDRKRGFVCFKCGKSFYRKEHLKRHMAIHEEVKKFQCNICKSSFKTKGRLQDHIFTHNNEKPFSCEQCGRCFRLLRQLKSHSIIHTDALPFICQYCNKGFRFKTRLTQHIPQHTGDKPYTCKICERDFTDWSNYNKHMKGQHNLDMAKKKRTLEGIYPIDPNIGEEEITKIMEWKKQMTSKQKKGRPKLKAKGANSD